MRVLVGDICVACVRASGITKINDQARAAGRSALAHRTQQKAIKT